MKRHLVACFLFWCLGNQFLAAQDMSIPDLDDFEVPSPQLIYRDNAGTSSNQFGRLSPEAVNHLESGQDYVSITNMLGAPLCKEPVIDIRRFREHNPETALWVVVYLHSDSDEIYYRMFFSGENARPAQLLAIDAMVMSDDRWLSIGSLSLLPAVELRKQSTSDGSVGTSTNVNSLVEQESDNSSLNPPDQSKADKATPSPESPTLAIRKKAEESRVSPKAPIKTVGE